MTKRVLHHASLGAIVALTILIAVEAGASTIAQNSSWTVTRTGATQTLRIVAYGDSIFAGYTGATTVARRAAPYVTGEYCAALLGQNVQIHRRCQSGGVAQDIYNRIHSTTDRAFMQDAATRLVTFEMCGNDYLQARSSFKSASGTCNYTGLNNAFANCKNYTQLAMNDINTFANANTKLKIVSNLYYPGFNADNSFSTCTDPVNGDPANGFRVNMQTLFIPRIAESNWWTCKLAADNGFLCADSFAEYMARDYDSNGDGLIDADAIRYKAGESVDDYKARIVALRSTLRDANFKMVNATTSFDYIQSDDTHPTFEGATATAASFIAPGGSNPVFFATTGAYPDGKNPHWNQNGHDRMGWGLDPSCPFIAPRCGNGAIETSWLPSGTSSTEACDDGNTTAGDGCSATCTIESGYSCSGAPSMCAPICGDGLVTGPEQCDDGNTAIGDGCSATCTVEPGFSCMGHPSACVHICGDGLIVNGEGCDDGNLVADDGCSDTCVVEEGWNCSGEPSMCSPICGDSLMVGTEACDDGGVNGTLANCCSENCNFEPSGTQCDDGNACTDDACNGVDAECHTTPTNCDDGNPCTDDTCDPSTGCKHTNNTASCSDGNACTTNDTCSDGACVPGAPPNCNDGNVCTDDSCNPATGCVNTNNTAPCSDGNACTTSDTCAAGSCVGGAPPNCNDGNGCTDDSCNPASGCVNTNNTAPCNDANACTTNDTCAGGTCVGGAPLNCNDGNVCTNDSCNPATGCLNTNNTAPCSDGNSCTAPDVCSLGSCVSGPPVYTFSSFEQPVDNEPVVNIGQAGKTYPVKWAAPLCAGGNFCQPDTVTVTYRQVVCDTRAPADTLETADTSGQSGLRCADGKYIFDWKTDKTFATKCYELRVTSNNGTTQTAQFSFTK
jgi:cysteine-rich repeat protein